MCEAENLDIVQILWAKSTPNHKLLWNHMIDSGVCAEVLASDMRFKSVLLLLAEMLKLSEVDTIQFIAYLAAIHDCGKAHPDFQKKSPNDAASLYAAGLISHVRDNEKGFRHERYGAELYQTKLTEFSPLSKEITGIIKSVISLHHQGKYGHCNNPKVNRSQWLDAADKLHSMAIDLFHPPLEKLSVCTHCDACVILLSSLVILADWISSSEPFLHLHANTDKEYYDLAKKTAENTIKRYGLHSNEEFPNLPSYCSLWPFLTDDKLRNVQRAMYEAWPDAELTIIEAPMGEGKTEAGVFYAARLCHLQHKQGIYFALPTAATSNQMFERIYKMLSHIQRNQPKLMHGMAWLAQAEMPEQLESDFQTDAEQWDWLRPMRRAMLAESGVGTVDQAMMAALQIRYSCLRLLGLAGKVLVLDEIHAYDAYMSSIIERLLQWCKALRIPVVMLSATLTAKKRQSLIENMGAHLEKANDAYPLITQVKNGEVKQLEVHGSAKEGRFFFNSINVWNNPAIIAATAIQKVTDGGCLCVMMNTVSEAQAVYTELTKQASKDTTIYLFHARMKAGDRDKIEKNCVELFGKAGSHRPEKAILVCTQVVEQSMDLDFDGMISCIAPIDLLLQRAGRVHRHTRPHRPLKLSEPVIDILVPEKVDYEAYGESGKVYDPWLLMQTHRVLPVSVGVPDGIRPVIEQVYADPTNVSEEWARMKFKEKQNSEQAKVCELPPPDPFEFFGWNLSDGVFDVEEQSDLVTAKTRLSEPTVRIALLDKELFEKAKASPPSSTVAKEVLMNSFTIRANEDDVKHYIKGSHLLRDVVLIEEESLPASIGNKILDYDSVLGAIMKRGESE